MSFICECAGLYRIQSSGEELMMKAASVSSRQCFGWEASVAFPSNAGDVTGLQSRQSRNVEAISSEPSDGVTSVERKPQGPRGRHTAFWVR